MAPHPPHVVDTRALSEVPLRLALPFPASAVAERLGVDHEFRPVGDGEIRLDVVREYAAVVVRGEVGVALAARCSRCLGPVHEAVACRVSHRLVMPEAAAGEARAAPSEDGEPDASLDAVDLAGQTVVRALPGRHLDILALVGEDLVLALPMRAVCRSKCRGLCPSCGTNLNTHPCDCAPAGRRGLLANLAQIKLS